MVTNDPCSYSPCPVGRMRPCNKIRHLRRSLAATCAFLQLCHPSSALSPSLSPLCTSTCSLAYLAFFSLSSPNQSSSDVWTGVSLNGKHCLFTSNVSLNKVPVCRLILFNVNFILESCIVRQYHEIMR